MSEIAFLGIGRVEPSRDWRTPPDAHDFHELILVRDGGMFVAGRDGRSRRLRPGDCALYPAGVLHREWSDPEHPVATTFLCFQGDIPERAITVHADDGGRILQLAQWLWERRLRPEESVDPWADACLRFILALWREPAATPSEDPRLRRLRHFLAGNLHRRLQLTELAAAAGMSTSHLLHFFRAQLGVSPMEYCQTLRCQEATRLLRYTGLPIKEIATQLGFADQYHFSKRFKRFAGVSPSRYRAGSDSGA